MNNTNERPDSETSPEDESSNTTESTTGEVGEEGPSSVDPKLTNRPPTMKDFTGIREYLKDLGITSKKKETSSDKNAVEDEKSTNDSTEQTGPAHE